MKKPIKENFGWHDQCGLDDELTGWLLDGGEEAYNKALIKYDDWSKSTTRAWIESYFSENWVPIKTDIDFKQYKPISTSDSLHITEERYIVDGDTYRLLYAIGYTGNPDVEILINEKINH